MRSGNTGTEHENNLTTRNNNNIETKSPRNDNQPADDTCATACIASGRPVAAVQADARSTALYYDILHASTTPFYIPAEGSTRWRRGSSCRRVAIISRSGLPSAVTGRGDNVFFLWGGGFIFHILIVRGLRSSFQNRSV